MMLVTSNKGKFAEYNLIFKENGIELEHFNLKYPEEQLENLEDVARRSVCYLTGIIKEKFFIDDSGIFIDALNGFPGVYSSYVQATLGNKGILKLMDGIENRRAVFRTSIAFYDGEIHFFNGEVEGIISYMERGNKGFGYDPIFIPNGERRTYAEMETAEKNMISHRGIATLKLINFIKKKEI